ncbi:MAG: NAD(P)/FAD-dependent oxidoreductase, partial [Bacteroidota bacterium]
EGEAFECRHLIPAIGQLHHPSMPPFDGIDDFQGPSFHSAQWNHDISLKGKNIGVVGNAASAVQFIPQIAKEAANVTVFQRSANWMLPKQDRLYKNWEKALVRRFPFLLKLYRNRIYLLAGGLFFLMKGGNQFLRKIYQKKTEKYIRKHIKDEETIQKLIPNYPMGAKRVLFSDDYYEALARPNVHLETANIERITAKGIQTSKKEHPFDLIVYSTGFKTNPFLLGLELIGKNGQALQDAWKNGPINYFGMTVSGFPNLYMMYGPNTNLGHNSIILMIEAQTRYIIECIEQMQRKNWKSIDTKPAAMKAYHEAIQGRLQNMVWSKIKGSWYQSANGNIPNNWPGRTMEYARVTKRVKWADFDCEPAS